MNTGLIDEFVRSGDVSTHPGLQKALELNRLQEADADEG